MHFQLAYISGVMKLLPSVSLSMGYSAKSVGYVTGLCLAVPKSVGYAIIIHTF